MAARQTTAKTYDEKVEELRKTSGRDDVQELRSQIDTIRADISALADLMGDIGSRKKDDVQRSVQDKIAALRAEAEAVGVQARDQIDTAGAKARDSMREQPGTTLAIATGLGFLAGLLMARK